MSDKTETTATIDTEQPPVTAATTTEAPPVAAPDNRTQEEKDADEVYRRARFLHESNYGPDPDLEIIRLPDGQDERGRTKFREWDFRGQQEAQAQPPTDKTAEAAAEDATAATTEEAAAAAAAPPAPVPKKKKPAAPRTEDVIEAASARAAEKVAEKVAEKLTQSAPPAPKQPEPTDGLNLTRRDQQTLAVLEGMEQQEGYKGIKAATLNWWKKEREFVAKWEEEHPGETFDRESREYQALAQRHNPEFAHPDFEADFDTTRQEQAAERVLSKKFSEREGQVRDREERVEAWMRMRDEAPEVSHLTMEGKTSFVEAVLPEAAKVARGEAEHLVLSPESAAKIEEAADPLEYMVANEMADELGVQLYELERLSRYGRAYPANPQLEVKLVTTGEKFFPHERLQRFATRLEQEIATDPKNRREGKEFLTSAEWERRVRDGQKADALGKSYYRLTVDDIRQALIDDYVAQAGRKVKELKKVVERAGSKKNGAVKPAAPSGNAAASAAANAATNVDNPPASRVRPKPPASESASDRSNARPPREMTEAERLEAVRSNY